jgi:hypothetical protein
MDLDLEQAQSGSVDSVDLVEKSEIGYRLVLLRQEILTCPAKSTRFSIEWDISGLYQRLTKWSIMIEHWFTQRCRWAA